MCRRLVGWVGLSLALAGVVGAQEAKKAVTLTGAWQQYLAGLSPQAALAIEAARRLVVGLLILLVARLVYLVIAAVVRRAGRKMEPRAAEPTRVDVRRQQHVATVVGLTANAAWYVIAIAAGILVLYHVFSVNVWPLLTGAGIVGIAIAFGSQALVRDVVTGVFQLMEGQYAVGDYVQIGGTFGRVEEVGLRVTRLRDVQSRLQFIPNGSITTVTTYDDPRERYVLQAPFADGARAEEARRAVELLAEDLRREYPQIIVSVEPPIVVLNESGAHAVDMRLAIEPSQGWLATDEIPARVKQLFAAREILIPEARPPRCYLEVAWAQRDG